MQSRFTTWALLAVGCFATGVAPGCMFERSGTETGTIDPARTGATDASLIEVDGPAAGDGRPGVGAGPDGATTGDAAAKDGPAGAAGLGMACSGTASCASGFCVDGVCCEAACEGTCQACNLPEHLGSCLPVRGAPRAGHGACLGQGPCAGTCDGASSACHYPGADVECAPARCSGGMAQAKALCSGTGSCQTAALISCAPFACDGVICANGCGPGRPCQPGNYCGGGRCFPVHDNGGVCASGDQCASGSCVDGRCCQTPSCGVCAACTGSAGTCQKITDAPDPDTCSGSEACGGDGQCRKRNGQTCQGDESCVSGFCVQGRCCDSACTGACQSCSLPGQVGSCRPLPVDADVKNCGRCGNACSSNHIAAVCSQGVCGGSCQPGFADCNANLGGDGCETNTDADPKNCGGCGTMCVGGVCEKLKLAWSASGPIVGQTCVAISEPSDPNGWDDNYLCTPRDFGLKWSSSGPIAGMVCTQWSETADPFTWFDNYLCAPVDYGLRWSSAGTIPDLRCTQILEPADPNTWNDNFLCAP
jgi:hypothetical protein